MEFIMDSIIDSICCSCPSIGAGSPIRAVEDEVSEAVADVLGALPMGCVSELTAELTIEAGVLRILASGVETVPAALAVELMRELTRLMVLPVPPVLPRQPVTAMQAHSAAAAITAFFIMNECFLSLIRRQSAVAV